MIATRQLGFLGKVVQGPHDSPAHNKDVIVQNLQLIFAQISKVVINDYGSMKDWFKEGSHESYWTALVRCLLDKQAPLPATHYMATTTPTQTLQTSISSLSTK
jgi:hypothetical protein